MKSLVQRLTDSELTPNYILSIPVVIGLTEETEYHFKQLQEYPTGYKRYYYVS